VPGAAPTTPAPVAAGRAPGETLSGVPVEPLYGPPAAEAAARLQADVGAPGAFPFTRGPYASMYRGRLWTMRMFAGYGTAEETNARFRHLLAGGQTGLSTAFDMPTLMGLDSDHVRAEGEVGREGVAVDTVQDVVDLFAGIPLDEVTVSMTINAPAPMLLAMYVVAAERHGIAAERSAARSRPTSSRSTSPRRSGSTRRARPSGWWST
jgi:methylmalonyl-CoA mutase N-terminal domain/subunit